MVVLLHGLALSADLNWLSCFGPLSDRFRVLGVDLRGHGRSDDWGSVSGLEDFADDVAALLEALDVPRFIAVGYSLGGLVAQSVWRRHPERLAGLVLCATSSSLGRSGLERSAFALALEGMEALTLAPFPFTLSSPALGFWLLGHLANPALRRWARREMERASTPAILAAAKAACRFDSSSWIGEVDLPVAVLVTLRDVVVSPRLQEQLAASIPGATTHVASCGHGGCLEAPQRLVPCLLEALNSVVDRSTRRQGAPPGALAGGGLAGV